MKYYLVFIVTLLLFSCTAPTVEVASDEIQFFDLKGFIEKEIEKQADVTVKKTVVLNGKEEERTVSDIDLAADLEIFKRSDINKVAWYDKYKVVEEGSVRKYLAQDTTLKTKELIIVYDGEHVKKITVKNEVDNQIYDTKELLVYMPEIGYNIKLEQKAVMKDNNITEVRVVYE